MEEIFLKEIQQEYKAINRKWLLIHYRISLGVVISVFILECIIGKLMFQTGEVSTTTTLYLLKFLIIPSSLNSLCILAGYIIIRSNHVSQNVQIYTISLLFVAINFIIFTVHGTFTALYFIFAVSILLTAIYGNYRLTVITTALTLVSKISSELLISWDLDKIGVMEDGIRLGNFLISLFVLLAFSAVSLVIIYFEKAKNITALHKELERYNLRYLVQIDDLTGLFNRIAFRNYISRMEEDISGNSYIFTMIDIDNFKLLNDRYGHVEGDKCLVELSKIMKENCGDATTFRYGGDEFCILFKNFTMNNVMECCNHIRKNFKGAYKDKNLPLSLSFGIAEYVQGSKPSTLIINSDKALYESKKHKDKITVFKETITV